MLPERDAEGYDGPRLVGTIGIGGMGWSVYDGSGPAVTMKTWGQGPGGATALYRDSTGRIRRLSQWEALRTHSFPDEFAEFLQRQPDVTAEDVYRLCGNSIPVLMLRDAVDHIITNIIRPQVLAKVTTATEAFCRARDEVAAARNAAARSQI